MYYMRMLSPDEATINGIEKLLRTKRKSKLATEVLGIITYWRKRETEQLFREASDLHLTKAQGIKKLLEVTA